MNRGKIVIAIVSVAALVWLTPSDLLAKRPGRSGQWNIAGGICGTVVDLATQLTTGHVFAAVQSGNLFCAGIYRSTDGGANFRKVGIDNPGFFGDAREITTGLLIISPSSDVLYPGTGTMIGADRRIITHQISVVVPFGR